MQSWMPKEEREGEFFFPLNILIYLGLPAPPVLNRSKMAATSSVVGILSDEARVRRAHHKIKGK